MSTPPRLEDLLAHAAWARALARKLVADPNVADDLVQEAYAAAAAGSGPRDSEPRGWLAEVLRNFARRRYRSESARKHREEHASRPEATSSAAELVERVQLEHALAAAVLALDEPLRETVLLRYFEGVASAEIARRQGVPESTVRNRLARALEQLRSRLDRERGGREAWMVAFVGAFGRDASALGGATVAAGGVVLMSKLVAGLVVAVAVGVGAFVFMQSREVAPHETPVSVAVTRGVELEPPEVEHVARGAATTVIVVAPAVDETLARLSGRAVDDAARPLAGVRARLHAHIARGIDASAAGVLELLDAWSDLTTDTDANGRFETRVTPDARLAYELDFTANGLRHGFVEVGALARGEQRDLGDVVLAREAKLLVRVVDDSGLVLTRGWRVTGRLLVPAPGMETSVEKWVHGDAPDANGVFELAGLAAGTWELSAKNEMNLGAAKREVELGIGDAKELDLGYHGPDMATSIVLYTESAFLEVQQIVLRAPGRVDAHPQQVRDSSLAFHFRDVAPGTYTIVIDAPDYRRWESEPVQPCAYVRAVLKGSVTLVVHPKDAAGRAWSGEYGLKLVSGLRAQDYTVPPGGTFRGSREQLLKRLGGFEPSDHRYAVLPGRYALLASLPNKAAQRIEIGELVSGEVRELDVVFGGAATLAGVVVEGDATTPAAGARVGVFRPAREGDASANLWLDLPETMHASLESSARTLVKSVTTGPDGSFRFEGLAPGTYHLRADRSALCMAVREGIALAPGADATELRLVLPATHAFSGRLVLAPLHDDLELSVELRPAARLPVGQEGIARHSWREGLRAAVDRDGRFRIEGAGEGEYSLTLVSPTIAIDIDPFSLDEFTPKALELGLVRLPGDAKDEQVFDVSDRFPARMRAVLTANGAPLANAVFLAVPAGGFAWSESWPARVDAHGVVAFERLTAGDWRLVVHQPTQRWVWDVPGVVSVKPGTPRELAIDVPLVRGRLTCTDAATSELLRNERLSVFLASLDGTKNMDVTTDAAGVLELDLPVGVHEFTDPRSMGSRAVRVEWTAAGPVPNSIAITRK